MYGISNLIAAIANVGQTAMINQRNAENVAATNASNEKQVRMQNEAAKKEAELAYKRSSAPNQVNLMRSAGMSRAGAISALNGGGSYTPAPVAASTAQAATAQPADLSALSNVGQMIQNMKIHKDLNRDQLDYNKDKDMLKGIFDTISNNKDDFGNSPTISDIYDVLNDKQRKALTNPKIREQVNDFINQTFAQNDASWSVHFNIAALREAEANADLATLARDIESANKDEKISSDKAQYLANKVNAALEQFRSKKVLENMDKMSDEDIQRLFELQATLNMIQQGLQYDGTQFVIEGGKKLLQLITKSKGIGRNIRTH